MRLILLVLALLVGALASPPAARAGGTLTIGLTQYPATLNPNIESMLAKVYVEGMTLRPLTAYDQDWKPVCMVCTELPDLAKGTAQLETTPDGRKGIAVTYSLQPDATWGDGTPVTTDDVKFTWEVGRNPNSGVSNFELYKRIYKLDVLDAKRFTFHLDRVDFDYQSAGDFRLLPAHIERPIFEADPAQYRFRTAFDSDPTNPGLAFGPYKIVSLTPGSEIVLARNPTWWGEKPFFDRVVLRTIENTAALEANLLSGSIDMIAGSLGLSLDQALAFEKRHGDAYRVIYKPRLVYEHLAPNLDNPILADLKVRQALLLGADRETISKQLFAGKQPVADSSVSPLDWIYDPDVEHYPYDPARAGRLLDEAGWHRGPGGIRRNDKGEPLRLSLMTTAGNRSRELVEQVLQAQWKQLGIEVTIKNEPARVFFGQTVTQRAFPGLAMFAWLSSPENVPRTTLYCDQIPTAENHWAGQNVQGYCNKDMDRLIDAIETELDRDKRKALWARLQARYAETLPALPLYWRADPYVLPKWLEGVRPTGHQNPTTLWIENWRRKDG
ncbi:peptide/nickel transport system substrate-binding protein [Tistlia consotensis]|uniref:Peptide/nickel transport system substrate-binding protein n=1 Tax=Tistlia consotensis USBA 355 TaxID=560819 RepID=A0A1Y6B2T6_9PROT|nr:peptide ABC transporter substrate-binding protein [Tistlia consotensis]SME88551.1 peptide/nickel transport system substrate-binding protein [Tistlia consotensis USBA 355]SNR25024.1 peptide/nickel transport system substrate-binding protein [Tistlia consotensis]